MKKIGTVKRRYCGDKRVGLQEWKTEIDGVLENQNIYVVYNGFNVSIFPLLKSIFFTMETCSFLGMVSYNEIANWKFPETLGSVTRQKLFRVIWESLCKCISFTKLTSTTSELHSSYAWLRFNCSVINSTWRIDVVLCTIPISASPIYSAFHAPDYKLFAR